MIHIAILGFGTVGGGVADVIEQNRAAIEKNVGDTVNIKKILDLREFPGTPWEKKVVHHIEEVTEDAEISIAVEAMGGSHPAYEFTTACLMAGKSVVTPNKEVVSNFGDEFLHLAKENGVRYLFEASVGGGIPIIRSLRTSYAGDEVVEINGILNGTTNYVLTQMERGAEFADALAEAQRLGYAERNPSADVDGIDTQRKVGILTALISGKLINPALIPTETMTSVTRRDTDAAAAAGFRVKLIGHIRKVGKQISAFVAPCFVPEGHPLAHISDVYNGIIVNSPVTGDVMYYGQGAGRYPTAGAVVSDIVNIANGAESVIDCDSWEKAGESFLLPIEAYKCRHYIRMRGEEAAATAAFGIVSPISSADGEIDFLTDTMSCAAADARIAACGTVTSHIRIL